MVFPVGFHQQEGDLLLVGQVKRLQQADNALFIDAFDNTHGVLTQKEYTLGLLLFALRFLSHSSDKELNS